MYNFKKTIELLVKALETKGKHYQITSKRFKVIDPNTNEIRYGRKFKYVDYSDKDNYIETSNNKEVLEFLLKEWELVKGEPTD